MHVVAFNNLKLNINNVLSTSIYLQVFVFLIILSMYTSVSLTPIRDIS